MTSSKTGVLAGVLATLTVIAAVAAATASAATKPPIIIGWAYDGKGNMRDDGTGPPRHPTSPTPSCP